MEERWLSVSEVCYHHFIPKLPEGADEITKKDGLFGMAFLLKILCKGLQLRELVNRGGNLRGRELSHRSNSNVVRGECNGNYRKKKIDCLAAFKSSKSSRSPFYLLGLP